MQFGGGKVVAVPKVTTSEQLVKKKCVPSSPTKQPTSQHGVKQSKVEKKKKGEPSNPITKKKNKSNTVNKLNVEKYVPKLSISLELSPSSNFVAPSPFDIKTNTVPRAYIGKLCKELPSKTSLLTKKEIEVAKKLWFEAIKSGTSPSSMKINYRKLLNFKLGDSLRAQCLVFPPSDYKPQRTSVVKNPEDLVVRVTNQPTAFTDGWDKVQNMKSFQELEELQMIQLAADASGAVKTGISTILTSKQNLTKLIIDSTTSRTNWLKDCR